MMVWYFLPGSGSPDPTRICGRWMSLGEELRVNRESSKEKIG